MKFIDYLDKHLLKEHNDNSLDNLMVEYAKNPIGIDVVSPRFSWRANHKERGQLQFAYQVLVASDPIRLDNGIGDMWDTGKVISNNSTNIEYKGELLTSGKICWWKVRTWDKDGIASDYSEKSKFEMGLLDQNDWQGDWIGMPTFENRCSFMFRKEIMLKEKILCARAYICGLGYYELWINGKKVGDHVLDPGNTNYSKRILYVTYEIENYLKNGLNAIGVIIGDGWYKTTGFILQINIEYESGEKQSVFSDPKTWSTVFSPITFNSIYGGEFYDSTFEKKEWNNVEFDLIAHYEEMYWHIISAIPVKPGQLISKELYKYKIARYRTMLLPSPGGILKAQMIEPIKVIAEIAPVSLSNPKLGIYVFDMGQNFAGWAKMKVEGPKGTVITLGFSELLYEDGTINQGYLQVAYKTNDLAQTDIYVLNGEGAEVFQPRFTYHGFRYVQIEGYPGKPDIDSITGCVVRSSVKTSGKFLCSNKLINKIQENVLWTESSNLHSIPTDCPQRDERQGWLNDMTARAEEAIYNFNMVRLYTKWIKDIKDAQDVKSGAIADTAPFRRALRPADPVSSSYLIVPWLIYLHYGDKRILEEHFEGLKKWTEYLEINSFDGIVGYSYWGDWASPKNECLKQTCDAYSVQTPGELISTGYFYYNTVLLSQMAKIIGKPDDEKRFLELGDIIKKAFNKTFFNEETNQYAKGSQASNTFALYLKLVPENKIKNVVDNLVYDIVELHDGHLTTGNLCTKYLLEVLTEYGQIDIAYALVTNTTYPSWGYMISKGATTIWERWEFEEGASMNSHNHPMYCSLSAWFYKYLSGINVDLTGVGFKKIIIKPYIPAKLDYATAELETVKGLVKSAWKKSEGSFKLDVTIPVNSTAKVYIPILINKKDTFEIRESGICVWKYGKFATCVQGVYSGKDEQGYILLEIGSGSYSFETKN